MDDATGSDTHVSLLSRLRRDPDDQSAWDEFVDRYGAKIHAWCVHWGVQDADALDITQMVLVRLASKLRRFRYDPERSFRAWLKTIARHAWLDFIADHRESVGSGDSAILRILETTAARDDLESRLAEAFDLELLQLASARVRERVEPRTWMAFQRTALDGLSGVEAAAELGMPVVSIFKAKSNVQKMLTLEIARQEGLDQA